MDRKTAALTLFGFSLGAILMIALQYAVIGLVVGWVLMLVVGAVGVTWSYATSAVVAMGVVFGLRIVRAVLR